MSASIYFIGNSLPRSEKVYIREGASQSSAHRFSIRRLIFMQFLRRNMFSIYWSVYNTIHCVQQNDFVKVKMAECKFTRLDAIIVSPAASTCFWSNCSMFTASMSRMHEQHINSDKLYLIISLTLKTAH